MRFVARTAGMCVQEQLVVQASAACTRNVRVVSTGLSPKGLSNTAQGCGAAATLGEIPRHARINPEGVAPCGTTLRNPVGVSRVSRVADPG